MGQHTQTVEKVVVIGASAGGIEALKQVFSGLPADIPVAVLVVQHLRSDRRTHLPEYLSHHSSLRVCLAQAGMPLKAGVGYIAIPGQHLYIAEGHLAMNLEEKIHYVRPSADVLFTSAAQAFGPDVIGVVLSGTGSDCAQGCLEIKAKGGVTIAQDEETSGHPAMPKASIDAGAIDYVLPLNEIADRIISLVCR